MPRTLRPTVEVGTAEIAVAKGSAPRAAKSLRDEIAKAARATEDHDLGPAAAAAAVTAARADLGHARALANGLSASASS